MKNDGFLAEQNVLVGNVPLQVNVNAVGMVSGDNVDGTTNIIPKMGLDRLAEGYRSLMGQIYSPKGFYQRVRTFLKEFRGPHVRTPMDFQRFLALFRTSLHLGLFSKERFQYWRLVFWTLILKPRLFPLAITLAIYGYHFRKVCERYIL